MKKIISVSFLALALVVSSCGDSKEEGKDGDKKDKKESKKSTITLCECVEIGNKISEKYKELGATDEFTKFEKSFADKLRECEVTKEEIGMENLAAEMAKCY